MSRFIIGIYYRELTVMIVETETSRDLTSASWELSSQWYKFKSESEALRTADTSSRPKAEDWGSSSQPGRMDGYPLLPLVVLFGPSGDWKGPTHTGRQCVSRVPWFKCWSSRNTRTQAHPKVRFNKIWAASNPGSLMHKINHHRRKWTSDLCVKRLGNSFSPRYPSCVYELAVYWRDSHHCSFYWKVVRKQKTLADRTSEPLEPGILVQAPPLPLTSHVSFW